MPRKKEAAKPITLNAEQEAVAQFRSGYAACYAGPGSGKSSVISERWIRLLEEGIPPSNVISLSFTAVAAKNLRERVEARVGKLSINRTIAGAVTFHSMALSLAQEERDEFPFKLAEFPLCPEPLANKLAGESARRYELDYRTLRSYVSLCKRHRRGPGAALRQAETSGVDVKSALAYKDFDRKLKSEGLLDFDSLLFETAELLEKKPEVRARYQYEFCMCDEAQDCCELDWLILKLLSEKHGNLLCVGDGGQAIYSFRGGSSDLFLNMHKTFPSTQKFFLGQNYRSSPQLVDFLKSIGPVKELSDVFFSTNGPGPDPEIFGFATPFDEANFVVNRIKAEAA